jgi:hypothetical protein
MGLSLSAPQRPIGLRSVDMAADAPAIAHLSASGRPMGLRGMYLAADAHRDGLPALNVCLWQLGGRQAQPAIGLVIQYVS